MKKLIVIAAMITATAAMADSVSLEYQNQDVKGSQNNNFYSMKYAKSFTSNLTADISTQTTVGVTDHKATERLEIGLTPSMDLNGIKLSTRFATGQKSNLGNDFGYYSIQPGVSIPVTASLNLNAAYRYRNAYGDGHNDETRTASLGLGYKLTKVDTVGVRFDRIRGDVEQNNYVVNYTRSF